MNQKQQFKQEFIDLYVETRIPDLLIGIAVKIKQYLDCEEVSMFLYYPDKQVLHFEVATGDKSQTLKTITLKKGTGIVGWVAEHRESVITNDPANDPRFAVAPDQKSHFKTHSLAAVPVESDGQLIGVLEAVNHQNDTFTPAHISLLEYIAQLIAIPLHNAMLFHITHEEKEQKKQLVKLGSEIATSLDPQTIYQTINSFVAGITSPTRFIITDYNQRKAYDILNNKELPYEPANISRVSPKPHIFQHPLKANGKEIGFLKLHTQTHISPESRPLLEGLAHLTAIAINRHENLEKLIKQERRDMEFSKAREIQKAVFPPPYSQLEGLEIACTYEPSSELGGDYHDIINISPDETIITVSDFCGHGLSAAIEMFAYSSYFKHRLKTNPQIPQIIEELHQLLVGCTPKNHNVSSFNALINTRDKTLSYLKCGHPSPFIIRDNGETIINLDQNHSLIGQELFEVKDWKMTAIDLESNDIICAFTDGITEAAPSEEGPQYSRQSLIECVHQHRTLPIKEILTTCMDSVKTHIKTDQFEDDSTLMIIKID